MILSMQGQTSASPLHFIPFIQFLIIYIYAYKCTFVILCLHGFRYRFEITVSLIILMFQFAHIKFQWKYNRFVNKIYIHK